MKKYLLAVLALGATMMMACNPSDDGKGTPEPPKADYELTTVSLGYMDYYGDAYGTGHSNFYLEIDVVEGTSGKILVAEYMLPADNTNGVGTLKPDADWLENLMAGSAKANHYFTGVVTEEGLYGTAYAEMDLTTEEFSVMEPIVDGDITVSYKDGQYTVKGLVVLGNGKTLKIDVTGELEYGDYSEAALLLSTKNIKFGHTPRFFSSIVK